jgi:hypothetical protein
MRWTKLKQLVEGMFAEEVRGRVALWTTRYEKAHDRFGRSWVTVDGVEVVSMSNYLAVGEGIADGNSRRFEAGVFAGYDLPAAMRAFLNLSIEGALASGNPLVRMLAVLDRRCGKRRLERIDLDAELSLVAGMVLLRRRTAPEDAG